MKSTRYIAGFLILACSVAVSPSAKAQNLDQRVEVTNAYEGKMIEVSKHDLPMQLPDSLMEFSSRFDYSVFNKPYSGSYEFNPYLLAMKPDPRQVSRDRFRASVGAGYTFHPEANVLYTPNVKGFTSLSVYDNFSGFAGTYLGVGTCPAGDGHWSGERIQDYSLEDTVEDWKGHDFSNELGASARLDFRALSFLFDAGLSSLYTSSSLARHGLNDASLGLTLTSRRDLFNWMFYRLSVQASAARDDLSVGAVDERQLAVKVRAGHGISDREDVLLDISWHGASLGGYAAGSTGYFTAAPKYAWVSESGRHSVQLGGILSVLSGDRVFFSPDVSASIQLLDRRAAVYFKADGGPELCSYSSVALRNHYYNPVVTASGTVSDRLQDVTVTRYDARLGFRGCLASRLQYDLRAGVASLDNTLYDVVRFAESVSAQDGTYYNPVEGVSYTFADSFMPYVQLSLDWKSDHVEAGASLRCQDQANNDFERSDIVMESAVRGGAWFKFHVKKRLTFGADCYAQNARHSLECGADCVPGARLTVPGWVDLGVNASWKTTSRLSFWLKGSNLLNQCVQRSLAYAPKGPWVTAGIAVAL